MNVDALLTPLSTEEGAEAGPDLTYSDDRSLIEAPFNADANGDEVDERGWRDCVNKTIAQAAETRDVWLAIYMMRGGAKLGDLQVVADGAQLLAGLFETMWVPVHPTLEEADFIGRKTPCDSLTRIREFLNPLRKCVVLEHRQGKVTAGDLERFANEGAGAEGYAQFRAAIDTSDPDKAEEIKATFVATVDRFDQIRDGIERIDAALVTNGGSGEATNFTVTYEALATLRGAVLPYAGIVEETAGDLQAEAGGDNGMVGQGGGPALSGRVNSRDDVVRAIDAIVDYYSSREPGHPVPVLMKRARHWVSMDFLSLLDDMVPDSLVTARQILVSKIDIPVEDNGY